MEQPPPPPSWRQPPPLPSSQTTELPPMRYGPPPTSAWQLFKKYVAPIGLVLILFVKWFAKLKVLIPALKFLPAMLKTGGSMILMMWTYTLIYKWWYAIGFVLLILVHECGHLIAAKKLGLKVGAPVFIPFLGAFIALKEAPKNAWIEAQVGIGGPLFGAAGAVACYGVYLWTEEPIFAALAYSGFFLNLLNLAPIGFLDGGRIVTVLSPWLWILGAILLIALLFVRFNFLVLLILALSLPRLFSLFRKRTDDEKRYFEVSPSRRVFMAMLYFGLAGALALGMKLIFDLGPATTDPRHSISR